MAAGGAQLRFDGRVAIVTGAGGGLGRAYALLLAARGAKVLVNDLGGALDGSGSSGRAADAVVDEIRAAGGTAVADYHSVTDGGAIVKAALAAFGQVDIVINNAGILRDASFAKMSPAAWEAVHAVHVTGAFAVTRAAWNHMRERRYGRVLFVSSAAGLYGNFGQANYSSAKLALVGLTNVLALEGARRGIHVNCVAPIAASRMTATVLPEDLLAALKPEAAAPAVAWLAHEDCEENGGVFELGAGWVSRLRLERGKGAYFPLPSRGAGGGDALKLPASDALEVWRSCSPEAIAAAWRRVTSWEGAEHPTSNQEVFGVLMEHMAAPAPAPAGPGFASDALFTTMAAAAAEDGAALVAGVGGVIHFVVTGGPSGAVAVWRAQLAEAPASVTFEGSAPPAGAKADVTLSIADSDMVALGSGKLNAQQAFMRGKLKLKGNMALAMKLGKVIEAGRQSGSAKL